MAALWLAAAPADATIVYASWRVYDQLVPLPNPQQLVSDSAAEFTYFGFPFSLVADFTETGLLLRQIDAPLLPVPVSGSWSMDFFFNHDAWTDGLTLERSSMGGGFAWSTSGSNHLRVSWQGLVASGLPGVAEFRNSAYVPEPATALSMLSGLVGLGVLARRPHAARRRPGAPRACRRRSPSGGGAVRQ